MTRKKRVRPHVLSTDPEVVAEAASVLINRCVNPAEFALWAEAGDRTIGATPSTIRDTFCADCLPWYQEFNTQEGSCWRSEQPAPLTLVPDGGPPSVSSEGSHLLDWSLARLITATDNPDLVEPRDESMD